MTEAGNSSTGSSMSNCRPSSLLRRRNNDGIKKDVTLIMETSEGCGRRQRGKVWYSGGRRRLSFCSEFQLLLFSRQLHFLPLIRVYHCVTHIMSLVLKNSHAGNEPDSCLTLQSLFWCTMATRHLFWSSFIPFLSLHAVEHQGCAIVMEIIWSERYSKS